MSIHRLDLLVQDYQEIDVTGPVLSVGHNRNGHPNRFDLWFEDNEPKPRKLAVYVFGTGNPTPWDRYTRHAYKFIGTVITSNKLLIWHVYVSQYLKGDPIPA